MKSAGENWFLKEEIRHIFFHDYKLHGIEPPVKQHIDALADIVREYGIDVSVGG